MAKLIDSNILIKRLKSDIESSKKQEKYYRKIFEYNEALLEVNNQENFEYCIGLIKDIIKSGKVTE